MKDSTKIKLQEAAYVLGIVGVTGGSLAMLYLSGKKAGHDEGYEEGYTNAVHKMDRAIQDIRKETMTDFLCHAYDPHTYDGVIENPTPGHWGLSEYELSAYVDEKTRAEAEAMFGPDCHMRLIVVPKPEGYDYLEHMPVPADCFIPSVTPPAIQEETKSIEEQPDIPTEVNELGEEVG